MEAVNNDSIKTGNNGQLVRMQGLQKQHHSQISLRNTDQEPPLAFRSDHVSGRYSQVMPVYAHMAVYAWYCFDTHRLVGLIML